MNNFTLIPPSVPVVASVTPKVGDILHGIYGYEATISTFARVTKVTASSVVLVEMEQLRTYRPGGSGMFWTTVPLFNARPAGRAVTKRFKQAERGYSVKWSSYQSLFSGYDGSPVDNENTH